jgi:hypothetical protein
MNAYQNLTLTRSGLRIIGLELGFDRDSKCREMSPQLLRARYDRAQNGLRWEFMLR